jgi:hypothetical protein
MNTNKCHVQILTMALLLSFGALSGCATPQYPITAGFHHTLPQPNTRIVVWGNHPVVTGTATTWLQKRGLRVVDRASLMQIIEEQHIRLTHSPYDEAQILRVGKILDAGVVVFTGSQSTYGGTVFIRGVEVETSEVLWSGNARYPLQSRNSQEDNLTKLTCQALATAWGFRPAGDQIIESMSMCAVGEQPVPLAP